MFNTQFTKFHIVKENLEIYLYFKNLLKIYSYNEKFENITW
jgi:hypothetical protein